MESEYRLRDLGDRRVLTVAGQEHTTGYSERVVRMLIDRKGARRAALYFPFKETRGRHFLAPLFAYLRAQGAHDLNVLEIGCSFGHITEYLDEQPEVARIFTVETDPAFVAMMRAKIEDGTLGKVTEVLGLGNDETRRLPYPDGAFHLVLAIGVVEHLPARNRRAQVDEYYRVLARGGHIAVLDTPNRAFPLETHSVGLPLVQWLPAPLAYRYARICRPGKFGAVSYGDFVADGTGWRNATYRECLPSHAAEALEDVTEAAGYGWRFFRDTAKSRLRRTTLPLFAAACRAMAATGRSPSCALPYFNLVFRKR
jgi:SAM-dependent methyltransferase